MFGDHIPLSRSSQSPGASFAWRRDRQQHPGDQLSRGKSWSEGLTRLAWPRRGGAAPVSRPVLMTALAMTSGWSQCVEPSRMRRSAALVIGGLLFATCANRPVSRADYVHVCARARSQDSGGGFAHVPRSNRSLIRSDRTMSSRPQSLPPRQLVVVGTLGCRAQRASLSVQWAHRPVPQSGIACPWTNAHAVLTVTLANSRPAIPTETYTSRRHPAYGRATVYSRLLNG